MGSEDGYPNELPIRTVTLSDFEMSKMEVTVRDYRACVEAGACSEPSTMTGDYCTWSSSPESKENHPINCVDWGQARTFAKWVGADLPTEAEWEYAARGGQPFEYAGSDNPNDVAWVDVKTNPVGAKQANGYGLYDMSGNVWEWVGDRFVPDLPGGVDVNGPASGSNRVLRGGSWSIFPQYARVAFRNYFTPDIRDYILGVRLLRTVP